MLKNGGITYPKQFSVRNNLELTSNKQQHEYININPLHYFTYGFIWLIMI